jgi:hypothetical protein
MPQILVVESEPDRVQKIRELVSALDADVLVAHSADTAEQVIATERPALVLTSAVTSPTLEARVMAAVRNLPSSIPIPVLTLPPLADAPAQPVEGARGSFRSFFSRSASKEPWVHYDADALGRRIREALTQSLQEREWAASREQLWTEAAERNAEPAFLKPAAPHERAPRFVSSQVPGLSQARLAWGHVVSIVNISRSGMLIESGSRFPEGAREEFELSAAGVLVRAQVRFVRSDITQAAGIGVRYQTAVAFDVDLPLPLDPASRRSLNLAGIKAPAALRDVFAWVQEEADRGAQASALVAAYELELQRLAGAREVRLCETPAIADGTGTSVFFTVPARDGDAVLRATFDVGYLPNRRALTLLKQAAQLAPNIIGDDRAVLEGVEA